jgi:hypothetical protein
MIIMQYIKVDLSVYETQLNALNEHYISNLAEGSTTTNFANPVIFMGFGYVLKSEYTLPFFPGYLEIVDSIPQWHEEEKSIQIIQSNNDCLNMLDEYWQIAQYRKENNIITYRENGMVYVYVNNLFPEHRALFLQFNSTINEK